MSMKNMTIKTISLSVVAMVCLGIPNSVFAAEEKGSTAGNGKQTEARKDDLKLIVAARVNGAEITLHSVVEAMGGMGGQKGHGGTTSKELAAAALDKLIFEELAMQEARRDGLTASPDEVDKKVSDLMGMFGGEEAFRKVAGEKGLSDEDLRTEIRRDIMLQKISDKEISQKIAAISEEDIKAAYERQKDRFTKAEHMVVTDTVLFLDPDDQDSSAKGEKIRKRILDDKEQNPLNIEQDGTFAAYDIEVKKDKQKEIYEEALKMKPGEISPVIRTGDSLHIIKLKEYVPEKRSGYTELKKFLESGLRNEAKRKRLREWEGELRKGAVIEIMDENTWKDKI